MTTNDWRHRSACAGLEPELFFPLDEATGSGTAKDVCGTCPVRRDCLAWALAEGVDDGVYGGLTSDERRQLRAADALRAAQARARQPKAPPASAKGRRRGRCGVCGGREWIRACGGMSWHRRKIGGQRVACEGNGTAPVDAPTGQRA